MYLKQQKFTACKASICSLTLGLFLCGCAVAQTKPECLAPADNAKVAKHINISVNAEGNLEFDNNECPSGRFTNPGDICNGHKVKPDIRFTLKGDKALKWEFIDIQLSADKDTWPWVGPLPVGVYSDFEFGSDTALLAGKPFWSKQGNSMLVQNNNCHEFTVHYRLTLQHGTTGEVVRLHPVMDNTGTQ